ncbi:MAG: hypothetical protein R3F50_14980 [Gammaproteobacteria bacterium]
MTSLPSDNPTYLQLEQAFTADDIKQLVDHIKASGELGRSPVYEALLDYLLRCSLAGKVPKEIEIAADALGKGSDYDVSRDSSVRAYVHQLRKKLDSYYDSHQAEAPYRIVIPKGQYAIAAVDNRPDAAVPAPARPASSRVSMRGLALTVILLFLANLVSLSLTRNADRIPPHAPPLVSSIWENLLDDDQPIMLVMGDYYIFGELNERGNIGRMVRDFTINSRNDLEERHFSDWETTHNYQDLDLSYMPEGSAYALSRIIPILSASGKHFQVVMMSDLTTIELRENHIIYVGYLSALDKLSDMVFAASNLQIGRSYDELLNTQTGRYYTSDAGLPEEGQQFRDYGFFSTFPASSENQILIVGGMRDAGLMYTAQALSDQSTLTELDSLLINPASSLEALYEVYGVDRMHFDGRLIYSDNPDPTLKWRQSLTDRNY